MKDEGKKNTVSCIARPASACFSVSPTEDARFDTSELLECCRERVLNTCAGEALARARVRLRADCARDKQKIRTDEI